MKEKELYKFWKKYVDDQYLCRIISKEYLKDTKRHGFQPEKDPFDNVKKDTYHLFKIILSLKKRDSS